MPIRWVINPVITTVQDPDVGTGRAGQRTFLRTEPKVNTLFDPGRPGKTYKHSSVIKEGDTWCLSFVRGVDMSTLDADPECVSLLEEDYEDADKRLEQTPNLLGWDDTKYTRVIDRIATKGGETLSLTKDTPLHEYITQVGKRIWPTFTGPRGTWVA